MTEPTSPSILTTIKKLLGLVEADTSFDVDIIMHINSALMFLNQLGVGPNPAYWITSKTETWANFLGASTNLESAKTYIYQKVRLAFDPPTSGVLVDALTKQISELEFRLNVQAEPRPQPIIEEEPI